MVNPVISNSAVTPTGASALQGTHPVDLSSIRPEAAAARSQIFNIPPEKQQELVASAFVDVIAKNPELLDQTVEEAAKRFPDIPTGAFQKSIDALVAQYPGVKVNDDSGNPLTLGKILQQVPQVLGTSVAKKAVGQWFAGLKEGPKALFVAIAAAAYVGTQGLKGLGRLGISLDVLKLPNDAGKINVSLIQNPKTNTGTGAKATGTFTAKSGASSATATVSGDTFGNTLFQGALNMVFGDRNVSLGATRSTADGQVYTIGYNGKNASLSATSTNGQVGVTAAYKLDKHWTIDAGTGVADPAPNGTAQNATYGRVTYGATF